MIDYIIFTIAGIAVGYLIKHISVKSKNNSIETKLNSTIQAKKEEAKKIILDSKEESKKIILEAEEKAADILKELRKEESVIKDKLNKTEDRLLKKEEFIDQKQLNIDKEKEKLNQDIEKVQSIKESIEKIKQETEEKLNKVSGLSKEEAKNLLLQKIEDESKDDLYQYVKKLETTNKEEIEKKVQNIMQTAVQRYAHENNSENLITTVALPNEEIKGRIIGKEGRNIHHFEKITGVELIIDDTPDVITISSFNPVRREVARLALEKLIQDGRIQPAKIEEKVAWAEEEIKKLIKKAGEDAIYEIGILDLPQELTFLLGRLNYRTSYGQNVLRHSLEVASLASMIALELGANVDVAKKSGLLHDIGKSIDYETEGTHVELGKRILQKYGVKKEIIDAMESHHEDVPISSLEGAIIAAADAISASRPGARKESLEKYLKRLHDLEEIANVFNKVKKSYAIQAGREIRVFVDAENTDDYTTLKLAKDIAKKIEEELKYPGEIKVVIIREKRAIEYAR